MKAPSEDDSSSEASDPSFIYVPRFLSAVFFSSTSACSRLWAQHSSRLIILGHSISARTWTRGYSDKLLVIHCITLSYLARENLADNGPVIIPYKVEKIYIYELCPYSLHGITTGHRVLGQCPPTLGGGECFFWKSFST